MYLIAIAWIYVVLMMALAEAMSAQGTVLGAIFTFVLYGCLPPEHRDVPAGHPHAPPRTVGGRSPTDEFRSRSRCELRDCPADSARGNLSRATRWRRPGAR